MWRNPVTSRHPFLDLALDLCWGQWTALGVAGNAVQRGHAIVDPEALVLFTGALGDIDPRLRDEAVDWCARYGSKVASASRMKHLLAGQADASTGRFIATVNEVAKTRWPLAGGQPWAVAVSGKSRLPSSEKQAPLARIQFRSIFGCNARAEVFLALAMNRSAQNQFVPVSTLRIVGYSRRNIAFVLEDLERANVLERRLGTKQAWYRLTKGGALRKLAPTVSTAILVPWHLVFRVLNSAVRFERAQADTPPLIRSIEAQRLMSDLAPTLGEIGLLPPQPVRGEEEGFAVLVMAWLLDALIPDAWR